MLRRTRGWRATQWENSPEPTRSGSRHLWAVLLAGGDGVRLQDLTAKIAGDARPKQFCPLTGADTLLSQTRRRLDPVFAGDRQVFVVSRAHEKYYSEELADAGGSLVIEQPVNRGTAVAMIAALVQIMRADAEAMVGFFPCDHHYSDDESFRSMVGSAVSGAELYPRSVVIVGAEAEYAETEYGWIQPGLAISQIEARSLSRVKRFWEKPALPVALALLGDGCLWNTFVTIGRAAAFLQLICSEIPDVVLSVTRAFADGDLADGYSRLPAVDFSRDILAHQASSLLVLRDAGSGWADLGSPERVLGLLAKSVDQPAWYRNAPNVCREIKP